MADSEQQSKIQPYIEASLEVSSFVGDLVAGVTGSSDERLRSENISQRKTYLVRSISHLKRLMSQSWFTESLTIDQFTTINNAIVSGEDYLG
jgi:hypothetical protein